VPEGFLAASGRVEGDEVNVASKLAGRIVELPVHEGQQVGRGELIARIDAEELKARLAQAEAAQAAAAMREGEMAQALGAARSLLAQAEAEAERAAADHRRYGRLLEEGVVSRSFFDRVEAEYRATGAAREAAAGRVREAAAGLAAARAQVRAGAAQVEEVGALLAEAEVVSPIAGTITEKVALEGEVVSVGAPIVVMVDLQAVYLKVYLKEALIGRLRLGDGARVYTDAFPERFFAAHVSEVAKEAEFTPKNVETREERVKLVFGVKLRIENPEGLLKPGLPAAALIRIDPRASWPTRWP